ncbi:MAG: protein kinase [Microcoleaceae cyanobacterium]
MSVLISPGAVLRSHYRVVRQLGHGGFGRTYLAQDQHRFEEFCVLKQFAPRDPEESSWQKSQELFEREAQTLYQLKHPQIPEFRELFREVLNGRTHLFVVQDYVAGPTYRTLLYERRAQDTCFSEAEGIQLMRQLLPVLVYIHSRGVIHRDISPENIIRRQADHLPVLIDFGGVKQFTAQTGGFGFGQVMPATRIGKPGYAPEEQLQLGIVHPHSDLYGLAVTILVLLTCKEPQFLIDLHQLRWNWRREVSLNPQFGAVLDRMLAHRPEDRYSSALEVLRVLEQLSSPGLNQPVSRQPTQPMQPSAAQSQANQNHPPQNQPVQHQSVQNRGLQHQPVQNQSIPIPSSVTSAPVQTQLPPDLTESQVTAEASVAVMESAPTAAVSPANLDLTPEVSNPPQRRFPRLQSVLLVLISMIVMGLLGWLLGHYVMDRTSPSPEKQFGGLGETERQELLRDRRLSLEVDYQFFVDLVNGTFYLRYPEQQGRILTREPEDRVWRERWDQVAYELLNRIEELSPEAREQLGTYEREDLRGWIRQVNRLNLSSEALYDLADAQFFNWFPEQTRKQNIISQPIGQIWYGITRDALTRLQDEEDLIVVAFDSGESRQTFSEELKPGEGKAYIANLEAFQNLRVSLKVPPESTFMSIYAPGRSQKPQALLEDSRRLSWSERAEESGYYEITIVSDRLEPLEYQLTIEVED